jgi:Tfp pilus assembly protein PilV
MSPELRGCEIEDRCSGFSLIEVLFAGTIMAVSLLAILSVFVIVYTNVTASGRMTMGMTAARQVFEDLRTVPFANLTDLNGFNTNDATTIPTNDPARTVARRWRYALAGEGAGFTFTTTEKQQWRTLTNDGNSFGGAGQLTVASPSTSLRSVTVRVTGPGQTPIQITTLVSAIQ